MASIAFPVNNGSNVWPAAAIIKKKNAMSSQGLNGMVVVLSQQCKCKCCNKVGGGSLAV